MVRLTTVTSTFHARVIAARIGAEGVVTQLRGNVDGPYPMGNVHVYVAEEDLPVAQELLLADEVESAFEDADDGHDAYTYPAVWMVFGAVIALTAVFFARYV